MAEVVDLHLNRGDRAASGAEDGHADRAGVWVEFPLGGGEPGRVKRKNQKKRKSKK